MMNSSEVLILFSLYITILLEKSQKKAKPHLDSWRISNIRVLQALDLPLVITIPFFHSLWNFQGSLHTCHIKVTGTVDFYHQQTMGQILSVLGFLSAPSMLMKLFSSQQPQVWPIASSMMVFHRFYRISYSNLNFLCT